jgi:hypothetical protein
MLFRESLTFLKNVLPLSSLPKSKPHKKSAEASDKLSEHVGIPA